MSQLKTLLIAAALILSAYAPGSLAQQQPDLHAAIVEAYGLVREGTRQILSEELLLTEEESKEFWPVYDEYTADLDEIEQRFLSLVKAYLQRYDRGILTDDDAEKILDASLKIQEDRLKIRRRYLRQFKRVLPGIKVARFYQLENKIQAEVDAVLAVAIPLADPR